MFYVEFMYSDFDGKIYLLTSFKREKIEKLSELKERDWKIVETQNGRSTPCSDTSPWKCHKRI